jgi:hypothetical protein
MKSLERRRTANKRGRKPMKQANQIKELKSEELELVTGGEANVCVYDSKNYSEGATLAMPGGTRTCQKDGTWKP